MEILDKEGKPQLLFCYDDICQLKQLLDTHLLLPKASTFEEVGQYDQGWGILEKIITVLDLIFEDKGKKYG